MSVIGIVGVCFALMSPTGAVDMKTEKCYFEKPIKFVSVRKCHAGVRLLLSMGMRGLIKTYYPKYPDRRAGHKVVYRATYKCSTK